MLSLWRRAPSCAYRMARMLGDDGHIVDDKKGGFAQREKSLENQYFRKKEQEELKKLRKELEKLKKKVKDLGKDD